MKRLLVIAVAIGCKGGGGDMRSGALDSAKLENLKLTFDGDRDVRVEMTLLRKDGKPYPGFVNEHVGPSVELELRTGDEKLCSASYHISPKELDPKTGRISSKTQFEGPAGSSCREALLKQGYTGQPSVRMKLGENGRVLVHGQRLADFVVPDNRPPILPELDAEIAALGKLIGDIDPVLVLPPCTPALVGSARLEGIDQPLFMAKPPPGSDAGWEWLRSPLFYAIADYAKREYAKPDELLARIKAARKILVFVADKHAAPRSIDGKTFEPGVFDGWIDVLDRDAGKAICAIELHARSSQKIDYTRKITKRRDEVVSSDSDATLRLRDDFQTNVGAAIAAALDRAGVGAAMPRFPDIQPRP